MVDTGAGPSISMAENVVGAWQQNLAEVTAVCHQVRYGWSRRRRNRQARLGEGDGMGWDGWGRGGGGVGCSWDGWMVVAAGGRASSFCGEPGTGAACMC